MRVVMMGMSRERVLLSKMKRMEWRSSKSLIKGEECLFEIFLMDYVFVSRGQRFADGCTYADLSLV